MSTVLTKQKVRAKTFPVIEIFGPTIQGEGSEAGLPCYFVRLGGCDFRCSWCDTMYAVEPSLVRENATRLSVSEIAERLGELEGDARWIILSGGNPALHELGELTQELQAAGFNVAVETQGSVWRDWLRDVDRLTISPKPPSSQMASSKHLAQLVSFMAMALADSENSAVLKIVCFDEVDLQWAKGIAARWPSIPLHLSAGTPVPAPPDLREAVAARFRWLCERVAHDPDLSHARVLPQLHVIAWGDATGV